MIVNISTRRPAPHLVFIALCSLFLLTSCSDGEENETAEFASEAEPHSEQAKDAVKIIESRPDLIEEIVVSRPEPELKLESAAEIERQPDNARLSASMAARSSSGSQQATASVERSPVIADNTNKIDDYRVVLGVDQTIKIPGLPGELRVWIGSPDYEPDFPERMTRDEATVPALGESATVEPFAPAFDIAPSHTQCIKIHPSGSEVRFKLTPHEQGTFEVGANVYLYDSADCSGAPIPKTAATLKVQVEVDNREIFIEKMRELWHVLWEKFIEFWGALLAIFFGLLLFLIRGKLKRWFGYGDN
jgi:hypothetical protein